MGRKKRKKYSCDFETTTDVNDCRVWAYGYMEIGNKTNMGIGNNIDDFMDFCKRSNGELYFHNLKFDGSFIVNWLMKNGFRWSKSGKPNTFSTVISGMGQWYVIDICYGYKGKEKLHTVIYDSLKKLPFKVAVIAKSFKLEMAKGEIDYHKIREVGYELDEEEKDYLVKDMAIVADALKIQFDQGLDRTTAGSDSLAGYKSIIGKKAFEKHFPTFTVEFDDIMREAYRGGFTWLNNKYAHKNIGEGIVFDVNSLYPSQMYDRLLPYGIPEYYEGKYEDDTDFPLYIQRIRCEFDLKEGYIPTIQIKDNPVFKATEYLKSSNGEIVELMVTNIDLEMMKEHYHLYDLEYVEGFKFRGKTGLFKDFIDKWTYIKVTSDGAIKQLAKLMLNSLYGKFATNPDVTGKIPYLKPDGSNGFRKGEEEFRKPIYTPMGAFITSWARFTTISAAQKCYDRIIYCDTDSIHLVGTEIPEAIADIVDDNKLGYWAHEGTFKQARYLRQKTYMYQLDLGNGKTKWSVKCAGMNDAVKEKVTFDNFHVGFSSFGKLMPKQVDGGVVLIDSEFTIK